MGEADIAAISALLEAASVADGHRALGEHQWLDLVQGGREGFAGLRRPRERPRAGDRLRADQPGQRRQLGGRVRRAPTMARRRRRRAADRAASTTALGEIRSQGGGHVHLWVPKPGPTDDAVAAAVGMRRGRDLIQMRRPLPSQRTSPPSIAVRPFRPGSDEPAWLEVNNRAFHGHPEQGSWDLATLAERERQPWFDPQGFLLHERDGRLAGFCWTKVHEPDDDVVNEGIDRARRDLRDRRRPGLPRSAASGASSSSPVWPRSTTGASARRCSTSTTTTRRRRKLYFSLGFVDDHTDRAYVTDVRGREVRPSPGPRRRPHGQVDDRP